MRISILGAGHAGTAVAADLSLRGHEVTLIKTSHAMHNKNFDYLIHNNGAVRLIEKDETRLAHIAHVTRDLSCISSTEIIIVYIQTNYHEQLIKRIKPYLRDGQILLLNPGYLSTAYVLKHCGDIKLTVVEAESSFIDCRISEPGTVSITFRNKRNPLGIFPANHREECEKKLNKLGYPFVYLPSVVDAALHNPNLIVHTIGGIMSIPRIEKTNGEYYMYREVFTPSVWSILEELDNEKMDVMEKLGCKRVPYVEACKFRNTLDDTRDAKEVFFWYANLPNPLKGPTRVDSRYITEDVPQGLVLLESLGLEYDVATPICSSLIDIASAALGRDFRLEGRTVERLGRDNLERIFQETGVGVYA
ncbi:MAG: NAD/NADP octopine/nopaline dehydrogenase [Clostridiaceae bacterium]|nr:NAD/NADP octopine/nopaline dehydrogenase [Clostridiaceae bacterium]